MGCIKHECINEGITKEIKEDDILKIKGKGLYQLNIK